MKEVSEGNLTGRLAETGITEKMTDEEDQRNVKALFRGRKDTHGGPLLFTALAVSQEIKREWLQADGPRNDEIEKLHEALRGEYGSPGPAGGGMPGG